MSLHEARTPLEVEWLPAAAEQAVGPVAEAEVPAVSGSAQAASGVLEAPYVQREPKDGAEAALVLSRQLAPQRALLSQALPCA